MLSQEDKIKQLAEEIYFYRVARRIGKREPVQRDLSNAKRFFNDDGDKNNLYTWLGEHHNLL